MNDVIDTIEYRGFNINIMIDECPLDPIKDWEIEGRMIFWKFKNQYNIGHKMYENINEKIKG